MSRKNTKVRKPARYGQVKNKETWRLVKHYEGDEFIKFLEEYIEMKAEEREEALRKELGV